MNISGSSDSSINGEYYYIRNLQGDIIGLIDKNGTEVVSYTYDTWGKIVSIEGSLKDTVGVKNPYRYRGYRYDTETGLYYLNARYYNPEWGRFINADGLIGQTGELSGHNLFVYCKNNTPNMSDKSGYRPIEVVNLNEETKEMRKASLAIMSNNSRNNTSTITLNNSSSAFSYKESAFKGTISSSVDEIRGVIAGTLIKGKKVWRDLGTLGLGKYEVSFSNGAKFSKSTIGLAGTIGFTAWDVVNSLADGEYFGAGIDVVSAAVGFGAGYLIGLGGAALVTAGAPALLIGAVGFGVGVGAGVVIDKISSGIKDTYYGR